MSDTTDDVWCPLHGKNFPGLRCHMCLPITSPAPSPVAPGETSRCTFPICECPGEERVCPPSPAPAPSGEEEGKTELISMLHMHGEAAATGASGSEAAAHDRIVDLFASLHQRLQQAEGERDGAIARAQIVLRAKNEWADRARAAEARATRAEQREGELIELSHCVETTLDVIDQITGGNMGAGVYLEAHRIHRLRCALNGQPWAWDGKEPPKPLATDEKEGV